MNPFQNLIVMISEPNVLTDFLLSSSAANVWLTDAEWLYVL